MRRFFALTPLAIVLVTVAGFWPTLQGEFNWDDEASLLNNPHYRGFGVSQLRWMFTTTLMGHYMPLTWLSLAADYTIGRMNPWAYHLTSLLLHALNAVLFYLVARRVLAHQEVRAAAPLLARVHERVDGTEVSVRQHVHHLLSFRYSSSSDESSSSISSSKLLPVNVMNTDSRVGAFP